MTCAEIEELVELYVIGALSLEEGREVAAHLDDCPGCRQLADQAREVTQLLSVSPDPLEPSPALRSRLLALVRQDAQRVAARPAARSGSWWTDLRAWLTPAPVRMSAAIAIVPVLLSGWLAVQVVQLRSEVRANETALTTSWQTSQAAADVMGKAMMSGGAMASLEGTEMAPQAWGRLYYTPAEGEAVLVVRGLPALGQGHVYQCWLQSGERRMNAGTFYRENDGGGLLVIRAPMPLDAIEAVNVTEEPHGGSVEPRGDRYVWGRIRRT